MSIVKKRKELTKKRYKGIHTRVILGLKGKTEV